MHHAAVMKTDAEANVILGFSAKRSCSSSKSLIPNDSGFGLGNSGLISDYLFQSAGAPRVTCVAHDFSPSCTFRRHRQSDAALQTQTQFTESIQY
jgi:hypothetical protein